ncbi:MAG TPA: 4a-hydroxytetrahydrobiopterin dehydratase [Gammaproteobacteria bacterium]|nr:4a-hydroxytetrahydrobiopterin dehydratase [Gammaproteobacteria bacterium]
MSLSEKTCVPCKGGVAPMARDEAERYQAQTPGWDLTHDATRIQREFKFKNFAQALEFVNKVGELSEAQQHHPEIAFGWGHVTVEIWTHKIHGLHENDFILAAKVNELV